MTGLERVEPTIPCQDVFPPGVLKKAHIAAYKAMEDAGEIKIDKILYKKSTDVTIFKYLSACPHEWVLAELKKRKQYDADAEQLTLGGGDPSCRV